MKFGLSQETLDKIKFVLSHYKNIEQVKIYGSRAKGNYREGSDIDLVLFSKNLSLQDLNKIRNDLDDLNLPYTFDICHYEEIQNVDLQDHIDRVAIEI